MVPLGTGTAYCLGEEWSEVPDDFVNDDNDIDDN